ncbi:hypothetical protein R6242_21935 [Iodobacter sp. CM08]|uniref:hypothetical protein n=1 Tax=Iodobacter sp. CM08 TaxID=3085902 RepID=UPI0029827AD7|nr:hypothetical protein [Iodobacter sp. CM08]MDW5419237.1 hypothetical protein [Iodobacter sp. CM08]
MHTIIKQSAIFLIKTIIFSIVFGIIWICLIRPTAPPEASAESANQTLAMKKYVEQATKAEEQQQRADLLLTKQEQQSQRLDAILSIWEKQTKIAK